MSCLQVIRSQCTSGHQLSWKCHQNKPPVCAKCERAAAIAQKKAEKDYELQQKRDAEQLAHIRKMADIEEAIAQQDQLMKDSQLAAERSAAILQKEKDLEAAISRAKNPPRLNKVSPMLSNQQNAMVTQNDSTKSDFNVESKSVPPLSSQGNQTSPTNTAGLPSDWYLKPSESEKEWERQKNVEGVSNPHVDAIMNMTGLEEVKEQVLTIKALIGTKKRQGIQFNRERLNIALLGNPGTGKTTVARSYGKLLASLQAIPGDAFIETTGSRLANDGVAGIKKQVEQVINAGGGTIFVDEAYQLTSKQNFQGGPVLDFLLAEMENNVGTIVFIVAGYNKEMESFFEHNPGLTSRVPYKIHFADYTNPELLYMFKKMLEAKFSGTLRIEGGIDGLYTRIAIRRLGRGRGTNGFGNARALQNTIDAILRRQAKRLNELRKQGQRPDDLLLCQSDLIGPDPSMARSQSRAWNKLQEMIGLKAVKATVRSLMEIIDGNYQRELQEREPIQISLNRVFLGSPGTGKTTVAKLYGQILVDLGLLSNGEVVVKNPADFIGAFLGESETKTKQILASTAGKVLVIDEAYMLYGGGAGTGGKSSDQFRTAVIDTLVAEIQSVPGEDRCVLLLGYKEQMEEMFQNVNPGLARRFAIEDAFNFEDFDDRQLLEILNLKLKDQHLSATDPAKLVAIQVLDRLRNRPNFGNAGEVENLLSQAKARYYQSRKNPNQVDIVFEAQDFDPEHDRGDRASTNLSKLFEDVVGCEEIVQKLTGYQQLAQALKKRGIEDRSQIPTNFVFKGPPGTGKTTVARKMGQVYYDMGFLSSKEVIECSASDLVGQYIGHTGPKTKKLLEKSLGRVLFIDEAYRLGEGHFAKEAIDELVAALTLDKFKSKIIVILAGYDQDMNNLLAVNAGLASRFPEEIHFRNMEPSRCLEVLQRELARKNVHLPELDLPVSEGYIHMFNLIHDLSILPSWGNARDMIQLSKKMIQIALLAAMTQGTPNETPMTISVADAINCIDEMYNSQQQRSRATATPKSKANDYPQFSPPRQPPAITPDATRTQSKTEKAPAPPQPPVEEITDMNANPDEEMQTAVAKRDKGVTDEVWNQLQACIQAEKEREEEIKQEAERLRILVKEQIEMARQQQLLAEKIARAAAKDAAEREELKRQREQARLKQLEALQEQRRLAAALEERRRVEEERRKKEAKAQSALRAMGVCVAGFRWINMGSGYRCAGGSHFVSNAHLGI
ncbi:hypothetical protein H0H81_003389 [Sphagnurus paluster]|uniref:AAA+ ATPase domain-containing protein n=1 Tax=Sphagnurus paluster TaxID=117069 RepID=A0A9P7K4C8_9AGAR|nr:hypothetical protein H0H81_003389 [Sphagnurus paluster]